MWLSQNNSFLFHPVTIIFSLVCCFLILTFLNVVSLIYTNVDLFTIDIAEVKKKNKRLMEKLEYVIKKSHSINFSICLLQTIITLLTSRMAFFEKSPSWLIYPLTIIQMALVELTPNYLVKYFDSKPKYLLNSFLLNTAYLVARFSPLTVLLSLSDDKKIFSHSEEDLIRFVTNLTSKEILLLEPKEAQLVNLAFRLDDRDIRKIFVPNERVVFLSTSMKEKKIRKVWAKKNLIKYPVLDEKGECIGVLNMRNLLAEAAKGSFLDLEKKDFWVSQINKNHSSLNPSTKLSEALEVLRKSENHFSIVVEERKMVGIITLNDVLSLLVGKISNES